MEPLNKHHANLKHPQSSMEPLNRREPDDYRSSINTRFATIHFPETRLHRHLELERCAVWFLEKEPSHWTIHFIEKRLLDTRDPSRTRSLRLHKLLALFLKRSLPHRSRAFVLCSDATSVVVRYACAPTLLLLRLYRDGLAPDGVGHRHH